MPYYLIFKILGSQRIQIHAEDSEWKFLSKRELIRFFEKDCQRQNVAAVAFVLFPREGQKGRGFAWQASEEDSELDPLDRGQAWGNQDKVAR